MLSWCISKISERNWRMIPEIQDISKLLGDGGIMLISEKEEIPPNCPERLWGFMYHGGNCFILLWLLYLTANAIASTYLLENDILLTEGQLLTLQGGIRSLSLLSAVLLFLALFLFLLGQKMAYLREIIQGVEALRTHRMDFTMPIEGDNELKELAESINFLRKRNGGCGSWKQSCRRKRNS